MGEFPWLRWVMMMDGCIKQSLCCQSAEAGSSSGLIVKPSACCLISSPPGRRKRRKRLPRRRWSPAAACEASSCQQPRRCSPSRPIKTSEVLHPGEAPATCCPPTLFMHQAPGWRWVGLQSTCSLRSDCWTPTTTSRLPVACDVSPVTKQTLAQGGRRPY